MRPQLPLPYQQLPLQPLLFLPAKVVGLFVLKLVITASKLWLILGDGNDGPWSSFSLRA
jgi:hypothetical protein